MRVLFLIMLVGYAVLSSGQNVGINTNTPDSSAILHLESTEMGFLPPRMTTLERDSIPTPADGLVIFNVTDSTLQYYNGVCWMHSYQKSCDECFFDIVLDTAFGTIDRIFSDSLTFTVTINQTSAITHTTSLFLLHGLPPLTTANFSQDTVVGSGSVDVTVITSIFDTPGNYPIAVQGICNSGIQVEVFYLTIDSCYQVNISSPFTNYDLQAINGLPGIGTPICVVADVEPGVVVSSNDPTVPAFSSGALDGLSHVGIRNVGLIEAEGGDGATGGALATFGNPGEAGGDALFLTTKTSIINTGYVFGGGGGGASVGFGTTFSIPVIGSFTLGIGAGGGGGCADGAGGTSGAIPLPIWANGQSATNGLLAIPGQGGLLNVPISIPLGPVTVTITPNIEGGDGGDYGIDGTDGSIFISASATIPIIGTISLPIPPITVPLPPGGAAGYCINKNGNTLIGLPDGNYQTANEKGEIGN